MQFVTIKRHDHMTLGRRQFLQACGTCAAGASAVALGFAPPRAYAGDSRQYKLLRAKETRNNCTYCSVGCGILMYSLGDGAKNAKPSIFTLKGTRIIPSAEVPCVPKGRGWSISFTVKGG